MIQTQTNIDIHMSLSHTVFWNVWQTVASFVNEMWFWIMAAEKVASIFSYLVTVNELEFFDEINCSDLFEGEDLRERIMIFSLAYY